jgi:hypothetical protein
VKLHGLVGGAEYNGKVAAVRSTSLPARDRFELELLESGERMDVRPANFVLVRLALDAKVILAPPCAFPLLRLKFCMNNLSKGIAQGFVWLSIQNMRGGVRMTLTGAPRCGCRSARRSRPAGCRRSVTATRRSTASGARRATAASLGRCTNPRVTPTPSGFESTANGRAVWPPGPLRGPPRSPSAGRSARSGPSGAVKRPSRFPM